MMINTNAESCEIVSTQEILDGFDIIRMFPFIEECEGDGDETMLCPDDFDE